MNKIILIALLIPALITFPILLQSADAFKLTNYDIRIEVDFNNNNDTAKELFFADLDSGLIAQNIYDVFEPIAVGQWNFNQNDLSDPSNDIIDDWQAKIITTSDTSIRNSHVVIKPTIVEINTPQGVNKATIQDQLVNEGVDQIRAWLQKYDITEYLWTLHYDGGIQIVEETP